jgi:hypothetical protein
VTFGDGAGIARQQLAVGPTRHTVVRRLHCLFGRDSLLARGRGSADADQASDLCDLEPGVAVEQEMTEQAAGIIIVAAALPEGKCALQQAALLGGQSVFGNLRLGEPLCKSAVRSTHEEFSMTSCHQEV